MLPSQSKVRAVPVRFASCRGVFFEIKPRTDPFAIQEPMKNIWSNWNRESFSTLFSPSRTSHSFDIDLEGDDEGETNEERELEEGKEERKQKPSPVQVPNKLEQQQPPTAQPSNQGSRLSVILLDQGLFTVYKRLFVVCLAVNIAFLVLAATGNFPYARDRASLFSIANILALAACRSEAVLRVVFWVTVKVLGRSWVPIQIKTAVTSVLQSLGGIHSGCGISSIAWLIYALHLTLKDRENTSPEIIAVASIILALLCLSSFAAFPLLRHLHHNVFERTHRFSGWTALAFLWAFIILTISSDPKTKSYNNDFGSRLVKKQEFWFTVAIALLIILPWIVVRRVAVKISSPSGQTSIIKFQGGVKPGLLGRISPSPFSEWHAFGIISNGKSEHMILASAVGDFTKSLVSNPPTHLWVRQIHFAGLPYLINLYNRVLLVATGSGIGPFLSFLLQPCKTDVRMFWIAKGIEKNFGKEIVEMMSGHPKDKVIVHDTAVLGRPNVSEMSVATAKKWGVEVVIVTSNPKGTRDIVNASKAVRIPAFGPIWDS